MEHNACLTELSACCAHELRCDLDEILTVVRLRDVKHSDGTVFFTAILVTVEMYACRARLVRHLTNSAILIDRLIEQSLVNIDLAALTCLFKLFLVLCFIDGDTISDHTQLVFQLLWDCVKGQYFVTICLERSSWRIVKLVKL